MQWPELARVERRQIHGGRDALGDQPRQGFTRCQCVEDAPDTMAGGT
jgi:hypothetical protein